MITIIIHQSSFYRRKAFKISTKSTKEVEFQNELLQNANEWDIQIEKAAKRMNSSYIFTVPDCNEPKLLKVMRRLNIQDYQVFNPYFEGTEHQISPELSHNFDPELITKRYLSHDETNIYIEKIALMIREANPKISVEVKVEGYSFENREIKSITIKHREKAESNPVIFIDAGVHAREWHSRSMALYMLYRFVHEASLDRNGLLYEASFVIVPGVNPDGYEYSRLGDKMWRKTRRPLSGECIGVDGNRNYDAHWNMGDRERYECTEVYRGSAPFSEPETSAIRDIMWRLKHVCKMYISIHTYGNSIIYPYGYTNAKHPRHAALHSIAQAGVDAVEAETGTKYVAGQSGSRFVLEILFCCNPDYNILPFQSYSLYIAAGGSDDYAIDEMNIPYSYTFELGPEEHNFAVPVEYLKKTLEEGWIALKAMCLKVATM